MASRERILDSAAKVFGQHGYRLASMELVAQECGLTRQALYHHFQSKEALFRGVVEAVHRSAFAAEKAAGLRQEQAGKALADILIAQLEARFRYLIDRIKGSAQAEELLSEHERQTRDLYQAFVEHKLRLIAATIERVCATEQLMFHDGMTAIELARCIELAARGFDLKKADADLLIDLERSIRLLVAGALSAAEKSSQRRAPGGEP